MHFSIQDKSLILNYLKNKFYKKIKIHRVGAGKPTGISLTPPSPHTHDIQTPSSLNPSTFVTSDLLTPHTVPNSSLLHTSL